MPPPGDSSSVAGILEIMLRDKPGELCSVLALPLGKWHWQSLPPSGPLDSAIIKRVGVGACEGSFQRCNYVNAWMSQFFAYTLARGFLLELLNLVLKALYKNFLTPFFQDSHSSYHPYSFPNPTILASQKVQLYPFHSLNLRPSLRHCSRPYLLLTASLSDFRLQYFNST